MFELFIEGFFLGIGAAVPLGPINILIMNHALKNYKSAVAFGAGAMSTDILYLALILLGLATFVNNPLVFKILGLLGSLFLGYMAYTLFKGRNKALAGEGEVCSTKSMLKHFGQGFLLTSVNPYTVVFWLSIAGYAVNKELNSTLLLLGMFSSILIWITVMPYFVHQSKHRISQRVSYFISIGSALLLGFFALSLFIKVFQ